MPVSGSDIPPELFKDIIWHICYPHYDLHDPIRKRAISACASTCRYWATQCRPVLFDRVTLRHAQDVLDLAAFLKSPITSFAPLSKYIWRLHLIPTSDSPPWIHLVPLMLLPTLPSGIRLSLNASFLAAFSPAPRSIHQRLPRLLPPSFSPYMLLEISDTHFKSAGDCFVLAAEIQGISSLTLRDVSWPDSPETSAVFCPLRFPTTLSALNSISRVGGPWAFPWMLSALSSRTETSKLRRGRVVADPSEHSVLLDLISAFRLDPPPDTEHVMWHSDCLHLQRDNALFKHTRRIRLSCIWRVANQTRYCIPRIDVHMAIDTALSQLQTPPTGGSLLRTRHLVLSFDNTDQSLLGEYNWAKFAQEAHSLSKLETVIVVFPTTASLSSFVETIGQPVLEKSLVKGTRLVYTCYRKVAWVDNLCIRFAGSSSTKEGQFHNVDTLPWVLEKQH